MRYRQNVLSGIVMNYRILPHLIGHNLWLPHENPTLQIVLNGVIFVYRSFQSGIGTSLRLRAVGRRGMTGQQQSA
jgi:hypothetical protein